MSKRKTHEEYALELAEKNPNIEVLGEYIDSKTSILHRCKIDNYEWYARPFKIMYGQGCPKCAGNAKKTTKEYIDELAIKNPSIEVVGEYCGANVKTMHHCLIHDIYWKATPSRMLDGCGCIECKKDKISLSNGKTHEQYVKDVKRINPNVVVIGKYSGINTPILHRCMLHDVEWMPHPISILHGCGCHQCGVDKLKGQKMKTNEQYVDELKRINPNIIPIEEYAGALKPILHKCIIDGCEWRITPANTLCGKGCPVCAGNSKKTHEEYIKEVELLNPNIEVVEKYINAKTPILHRCKIDNHTWKAAPTDILCGKGCPYCAKNIKRTHDEYVFKVSFVNPNVEVVGQYINLSTSILHKCLIHNIEWLAYPSSILRGCGCEECKKEKVGNKLRKSQEIYVDEVFLVNPDIEVIGIYINANTPILHKCKIDGYEWYASPANILYGYGCPVCHESSGERQVRQWLSKHEIKFEYQKVFEDCRDIMPLPFDFYLPDYNIAIEYQGGQHYKPVERFGGEEKFKLQQKHDNIKREYCRNNNIKLLEIPYYTNVEEELNNFLFI